MAPLVRELKGAIGIESLVCITGQHREMLDQVMELFSIQADYDLDVMRANQGLSGLCAALMTRLDALYEEVRPDRVLVHGDTTTAMAAAVAAFHRRIPVGHVEAGLRTGDLQHPWPEEMNRRVIDVIADQLFAPTAQAKKSLLQEHLVGKITVTGNTVIDALKQTVARLVLDVPLQAKVDASLQMLDPARRILLVTGHRRESFGQGFEQICKALVQLAHRTDLQIVYPVHLNPNVLVPVRAHLGGLENVHLLPPQDYLSFVHLMQRADVILTDSGGVQEEAPALGKPVLVMRDVTERPEAVQAGAVSLVGTTVDHIVEGVEHALAHLVPSNGFDPSASPYGDGLASARIVAVLQGKPINEFESVRRHVLAPHHYLKAIP